MTGSMNQHVRQLGDEKLVEGGNLPMELNPQGQSWIENYKLLIGSIVPRPIAFVSTESREGIRNLAAFSFFNGVCPKPFIISFAPMFKTANGGPKDTLKNIEETDEFVVNIVSESIVEQMNRTAPEYDFEVDEFDVAKLTPIASVVVKPPRVAESKIQMECKKVNILKFGSGAGAGALVLGEVVRMHVEDSVYREGKIILEELAPVARMAGDTYARATDLFELKRPTL
ncbi:flavin reductase family protein [Alicyclobacillus sp. SP_1]|uniref:flavin reductase family protein n=1 Tax=Alicyclobacillus sp. SP_1 TaxID=2942475 RepID=UPI0028043411|nr:flavin reductase family protein [Alicyclobacillus sp. SP_1]